MTLLSFQKCREVGLGGERRSDWEESRLHNEGASSCVRRWLRTSQ